MFRHMLHVAIGVVVQIPNDLRDPHHTAIGLWAGQELPAAALDNLRSLQFVIADLPDQTLATFVGSTITVDSNAAGWGWFVDQTPISDDEFALVVGEFALQAAAGSEAAGKMDLLTVLLHEMGHSLGVDHLESQGAASLMLPIIGTGTRRKLDPLIVDELLAHEMWN